MHATHVYTGKTIAMTEVGVVALGDLVTDGLIETGELCLQYYKSSPSHVFSDTYISSGLACILT